MDKVIFKKDIALAEYPYTLYFIKDKEYEVLDEDKEYIYVRNKTNSNQCTKVPKTDEGTLFEYK
ncbi:hypothetical protein [Bacillus pumilus]|uniref:hypothetical protein n=1 Tax=Bacillus pumilus TaxID=1408 RepID=UPI0005C52BDC|nr:hypothetical protein [Bacillus pumilus]